MCCLVSLEADLDFDFYNKWSSEVSRQDSWVLIQGQVLEDGFVSGWRKAVKTQVSEERTRCTDAGSNTS